VDRLAPVEAVDAAALYRDYVLALFRVGVNRKRKEVGGEGRRGDGDLTGVVCRRRVPQFLQK
jgi:hypothetical protein